MVQVKQRANELKSNGYTSFSNENEEVKVEGNIVEQNNVVTIELSFKILSEKRPDDYINSGSPGLFGESVRVVEEILREAGHDIENLEIGLKNDLGSEPHYFRELDS